MRPRGGHPTRRASGAALLALVLVLLCGCASKILGPGSGETNADLGIGNALLTIRPGAAGFGPETGLSLSAQKDLARALDLVVGRLDMTEAKGRTVYVAGFPAARGAAISPRERKARVETAYVAQRLAQRVVEATGRAALEPASAEIAFIPWVQHHGGVTTYREWRQYGYPIYFHEEDQRPARVSVLLYDARKRRVDLLDGDRTWQVKVESYILGIIPIEWFVGF